MEQSAFHISLYVADINKTVAFYTDLFGQNPTKTKTDYAKFEVPALNLVISFVENAHKAGMPFGHLGIKVNTKAEVLDKLTALTAKNYSIKEEFDTVCCYAHQDKFWVADPDSYQWEVYTFNHDTEASKTLEPKTQEAPSCAPGSGCC